MSQNKKLRVAMQLVLAVSATGAATILHNAPAGAVAYAPSDFVTADATTTQGTAGASGSNLGKNIVGTAKAEILSQITQAKITELNFGKVVPSAIAGTIVVAADGTVTNTDGARYIPTSGATNATLSFSGDQDQNISITAAATATISSGSNNMTVTFNYPTLPNKIGASGLVSMPYGATLAVGAGQAAGIYTGTYDIFVTYLA